MVEFYGLVQFLFPSSCLLLESNQKLWFFFSLKKKDQM